MTTKAGERMLPVLSPSHAAKYGADPIREAL